MAADLSSVSLYPGWAGLSLRGAPSPPLPSPPVSLSLTPLLAFPPSKPHSKSKPGTSHIPTSPSKATGSIYAPLVSAPPVAVFVHFYGLHLVYVESEASQAVPKEPCELASDQCREAKMLPWIFTTTCLLFDWYLKETHLEIETNAEIERSYFVVVVLGHVFCRALVSFLEQPQSNRNLMLSHQWVSCCFFEKILLLSHC